MRIAHLLMCPVFGGAERLVTDVARIHQETGHEVILLFLDKNGPLLERLDAAGIPWHCFHRSPSGDSWTHRAIRTNRRKGLLRTFLEEWKPDILHSHLVTPGIVAHLAVSGTPGVTHVHTIHNEDPQFQGDGLLPRFHRWIYRRMIHRGANLIACSENVRSFLVENLPCRPESIALMTNGADTDHFPARESYRQDPERFEMVTVANFLPQKAYDFMLEVVGDLARDGVNLRSTWVGTGSELEPIRQMVAQAGLNDVVRFTGAVSDVLPYLEEADLYVHPADREGLPMAILEAMSTGLPVVATSIGVLPEVVRESREGYLVPVRDRKAMIERIMQFIFHPERREKMGRSAAARIREEYSLRVHVERLTGLYEDAIKRHLAG